jgi:Clostripain family
MNEKEWTIMIYMAGDNNLAVDMAYAMEQIKEVAKQGDDSPNLFVYYDGNSPAIPTLYCDFSEPGKPRYVRSHKVPKKLYWVPDKQNENAADKFAIWNFIDWCVNKVEVEHNGEISFGRRAQKYALIFSGHSLGFQDIGLFKDESSGKSMKMEDFFVALARATFNEEELEAIADEHNWEGEDREIPTTVLLGQPLDLLGFDSCVMGMLEVGYQFSGSAKTIIASEGSVPSAGWTYAKILGCLASENNSNGEDVDRTVAEKFVKEFIRSQDSYTVGGASVDMAAWDMRKIDDLAKAFNKLAEVLIECFDDEESRIYRQMERVILQVHWKCQSYMFDQNVDLGDFCELLDQECGRVIDELGDGDDLKQLKKVQKTCRKVLDELKETVILSGFSGGGYQYSNGVSVFFPWSREAYQVSKKNYESLWFSKEAKRRNLSWRAFLKKYLYEVSRRKCEPTDENVPVGMRYRYESGVKYDERWEVEAMSFAAAAGVGADTKIAGQEGTKIAGQEGTKIAGQEGTKIAGQEGTKIAGQEGTKIAGQEGTKIAGQEGTKLAGGGSSRFFESLRLFKNIESRWDISGFTKKTE